MLATSSANNSNAPTTTSSIPTLVQTTKHIIDLIQELYYYDSDYYQEIYKIKENYIINDLKQRFEKRES